ncbi:hypothetical protein RvY_00156 [Ramazzottius varieornatus]|uniref:Protein kinase domain-containing protein n=1 Tax=Ramazzottius varieornatus TaxID=947166 RepID=A0A1D1UJ67_RAMVA|nr:hypothetical protein RvY_00156 [Ramazzottius varieornatus]
MYEYARKLMWNILVPSEDVLALADKKVKGVGFGTDTPKRYIWSFGCILVHMLTGRQLTYRAEKVNDSLSSRDDSGIIQSNFVHRVREMGLPVLPSGIGGEESKDLVKIIKKCFVKDTLVRLSASQLLESSFFGGRSSTSSPDSDTADGNIADPYNETAFRDFASL